MELNKSAGIFTLPFLSGLLKSFSLNLATALSRFHVVLQISANEGYFSEYLAQNFQLNTFQFL